MLFSDEVIRRAYEVMLHDFNHWVVTHAMADVDVESQVIEALRLNDGEPYQTARYLEDVYDWHPDMHLLELFRSIVAQLDSKIYGVTLEWVVRTKIRFPARLGELIVYRDIWGYLRTARVIEVRNAEATARVEAEDSSKTDFVYAEDVVENKTTGENAFDLRKKRPLTLTKKPAEK